jgi:hypothetical protein
MGLLRLKLVLSAVMALATDIGTIQAQDTGAAKTVIVQMFEWTWDSIATECTNFLGTAGYGYVQGAYFSTLSLESNLTLFAFSESRTGTYRRATMVDGLSTGIIQSYFKTWKP